MRFKGWLRSPGETHKGLSVVLDIEDTGVTAYTGDRQLGWWAPGDVALERGEGTVFLFQVENEHWFFEPENPMRLLFEGMPLLETGQQMNPVLSRPTSWRRQNAAENLDVEAETEPEKPNAGQSAIPSLVWGLLTATLLFAGVLVGVVVGRFRADGRNLVTGVIIFAALLVGFLWGRMMWQRASRRRVNIPAPASGSGLAAGGVPILAELPATTDRPTLAASRSALSNGSRGESPDVDEDALPDVVSSQTANRTNADATGSGHRGIRVRGDKSLLGVVLGDSFELKIEQEQQGKVIDAEPAIDRFEPDDLKQIKGIGPASEKILNDLGHTTFEDVALLSSEQIGEIQAEMKGFKNRVYSDGWCLNAARLYRQKYGAFPARRLEAERA